MGMNGIIPDTHRCKHPAITYSPTYWRQKPPSLR
jgi:hypothetical protein